MLAPGKLLIINSDDGQTIEELPIPAEEVAFIQIGHGRAMGVLVFLPLLDSNPSSTTYQYQALKSTLVHKVSVWFAAIWEEIDGVWGAPEVLIPPPAGEFNIGRAFDPSGIGLLIKYPDQTRIK